MGREDVRQRGPRKIYGAERPAGHLQVEFGEFVGGFREILSTKTHPVDVVEKSTWLSPLAKCVSDDDEDLYRHFPCSSIRCVLRTLSEVVPNSAMTQELTDPVDCVRQIRYCCVEFAAFVDCLLLRSRTAAHETLTCPLRVGTSSVAADRPDAATI